MAEEEIHAHSGYGMRGVAVVLLRISRACGAAPVTFERQRSLHIVRVARRYAILDCVISVLMSVTVLASLLYEANAENSQSAEPGEMIPPIMTRSLHYALTCIVFIVAAFTGPGRIRRFMSYLKRIQKIHGSIEINPSSVTLETTWSIILAVGLTIDVVACVANVVMSIYHSWRSHSNLVVQAVYMLVYMATAISSLLVLQITFIVTAALWALKALNGRIKNLQGHIQCDEVNRADNSAVTDTIRRFASIYTSIVNVCGEINATEGFVMLLLLFEFTLRILAFGFYVTSKTYLGSSSWMYVEVAGPVLHCSRLAFHVVMLVEPCHRMFGELRKTQVLISQQLCVPSSALDAVSVALVRFYETTEPCSYVFVPLGTFKFSRSLYTALIGALSTVIIIMAQI